MTTYVFGQKKQRVSVVLYEEFTGDGSDVTFQLTSSPANATWLATHGAWAAGNIHTTYPGHVTKTNKKPIYDSIIPLTRNRIGVSSISAGGLVTLDYAPRNNVDFYVWYWYQLSTDDILSAYHRPDFIASMEGEMIGAINLYDTDSSNVLSLIWNEDDSSDRILNLLVNSADRTLDLSESLKILDGQDIELHASGGEKAQLAIDTQNAERTLDMSENLTIADGYNFTLQALGQANSLILNESLTIGDGNSGTITFSAASKTVTVAGSCTLNDWFDQAVKAASTPAFAGLSLTGNLVLAGNSITGTSVDISNAELQQLSLIGATTISGAQWGYLGGATAAGGAVLDAADDAAILALLSGDAGAAFSWNSQNLTSVGTIDFLACQLKKPAFWDAGDLFLWNPEGASSPTASNAWYFYDASEEVYTKILSVYRAGDVDVVAHDAATLGLKLGGTLVTASAAEINYLEGLNQNLTTTTNVTFGTIGCGDITTTGDYLLANGNYVGISANERLEFYSAGYAAFMGCDVGIGTVTPGNKADIITGSTSSQEFHLGEVNNEGMYMGSWVDSHFLITAGYEYVSGSFYARATSASGIGAYLGDLYFYTDTSLTDGDTFTPTVRMTIDEVGNIDIIAHDAATLGLKLGGTLVTASAAEINYLEGLNQNLTTTTNVTFAGLTLSGGFKANLVTKTGNYTATSNDYTIICNATSGSFTITLPAVASHTNRMYHIKKIDSSANTVTVDGNASETIDDSTTAVLTTQYESITIQSDGSEWWII